MVIDRSNAVLTLSLGLTEMLVIVDQIPRNPVGKVQKALLKEMLKKIKEEEAKEKKEM